jgi:hypothetical protein
MSRLNKTLLLASLLLATALSRAAADDASLRYTPPSATFVCDLPSQNWYPFEEEEGAGFATHILGPDNPSGTYRTGIDIRWIEKGQPGWVPVMKYIEDVRRSDKETDRTATLMQPYRFSGFLARLFEVVERRRLPDSQIPSMEEEIHDYYAIIPVGESYYSVKLSSTRDVYLDYKDLFNKFMQSFKTLGR